MDAITEQNIPIAVMTALVIQGIRILHIAVVAFLPPRIVEGVIIIPLIAAGALVILGTTIQDVTCRLLGVLDAGI